MSRAWLIFRLARIPVALLAIAGSIGVATSVAQHTVADPLAPLDRLTGKTWRGEMTGSTPENPLIDVVRYERVLNGKAVRALHSINAGAYGGETIYFWDSTPQSIVYYYFTTAGFYSEGTATFEENRMRTHETVRGNAGGITEVRATAEFLDDGSMHVLAEYLKAGDWAVGHRAVYVPDSVAVVVLP